MNGAACASKAGRSLFVANTTACPLGSVSRNTGKRAPRQLASLPNQDEVMPAARKVSYDGDAPNT